MNKQIEKDLKKYYSDISNELVYNRKKKRKILRNIEKNTQTYCEEHPGADVDEIIHHFGDPSEIAQAYYDNASAEEISSKIKSSHKIFETILAVLFLALLLYIVIIVASLVHNIKNTDSYSETVINETVQAEIIKGE